MANLIIEMPDDLVRSLEGIAARQHKSVQQLAVERLRSLVESNIEPLPGSADAVLRAMREPPHPSVSDVEELDAAIASGRIPIRARDLFWNDPTVIFLLDTNAISALMREDAGTASWLSSVQSDDRVVICSIGRGEILFGISRLALGRRRSGLVAKARQLFAALPCESIPPAAGDHYATVKLAQQRIGLSLDENDLWMAATALSLGATLVSSDRDFLRVEMLAVVVP